MGFYDSIWRVYACSVYFTITSKIYGCNWATTIYSKPKRATSNAICCRCNFNCATHFYPIFLLTKELCIWFNSWWNERLEIRKFVGQDDKFENRYIPNQLL